MAEPTLTTVLSRAKVTMLLLNSGCARLVMFVMGRCTMRSLVFVALITCLTLVVVGCGCKKQPEQPDESQSVSVDDAEPAPPAAAQDSPEGGERPRNPVTYGPHTEIVAILLGTNPWLTVIGSDTPRVAVYADGTVVYLAKLPGQSKWTYLETVLAENELEALKQKLGPTEEFMALEGFYDLAPNITDQPRTKIYLSDGTHTEAVSIRSYSSRAEREEAQQEWPEATWPEVYEQLGEFDRVYDILTSLRGADAREWEPQYVELYVCGTWSLDEWREQFKPGEGFGLSEPYSDPQQWPEDWPAFDDPLTWQWSDNRYSLYVPGSALREVEAFFASKSTGGGVLIDGRVYCPSWRYVFPGEGTYRDAFDEAEKDDNPLRLGL